MDPDEIKHELYSTKVMEYREEYRIAYGESRSSGTSRGSQRGSSSGAGAGGTQSFPGDGTEREPLSTSESWSQFAADSGSESESSSESFTQSKSYIPTLIPVMGKELSHVQWQGVARLVGMNAPVSLFTPNIDKVPSSKERTQGFLDRCYAKLPFALRSVDARKVLAERELNFADELMTEVGDKNTPVKRRIKSP